jgi:hypothetical protein
MHVIFGKNRAGMFPPIWRKRNSNILCGTGCIESSSPQFHHAMNGITNEVVKRCAD